jgi:hypothetical protein
MVSNLALFCLATFLATFQKLGDFFPNHLVTLKEIKTTERQRERVCEIGRVAARRGSVSCKNDR